MNGSNTGASPRGFPHLPTGVSAADIGLGASRGEILAMLMRMHPGDGAPWTAPPFNESMREYELTVFWHTTEIALSGR